MSRRSAGLARREIGARIILGQTEVEIAHLFFEAMKSFEQSDGATLRAMNIHTEDSRRRAR